MNRKIFLGKGRSGVVYLETNSQGKLIATKVFTGDDFLAKAANYIFYGAPNAYSWNEDAVICAHLRRKILDKLIPSWFNGKLKIANSFGTAWNSELKAFEIQTEFIHGRHAGLHHPYSISYEWELNDLVENITEPLQKKLEETGFDGLVWQAGKGNPTATSNFMLCANTWIWIDAESGVPALFPLNPIALFTFYLPKAFRYRQPMFDDVDIKKLKAYLANHQPQLKNQSGSTGVEEINQYVNELEEHQEKWKAMSRVKRSILSRLKIDKIDQQQADFYLRHPLLWYALDLLRIFIFILRFIFYSLPLKLVTKIGKFPYRLFFENALAFIFYNAKRKKIIENYFSYRISKWVNRKHLSEKHAELLRGQLVHEGTTPYLTDFMVVLSLKPIMNVVELVTLPSLYALGVINEVVLGIGIAFGGSIYRTLYTLIRMIIETRKPPAARLSRTIALLIGVLPTVGNGSYAIQMIFTAARGSKELAEFILYDMSSMIGHKVPIWGGKDTRIEHFFNHFPDILVRDREEIKASSSSV